MNRRVVAPASMDGGELMASCAICGTALTADTKFCGRCGYRTGGGSGPADPAFAAPPAAPVRPSGTNHVAIILLSIALIAAIAIIVWLVLARPVSEQPVIDRDGGTSDAEAVEAEVIEAAPPTDAAKPIPPPIDQPAPQPMAPITVAEPARPNVTGRYYNIYASLDDGSRNIDRQAQGFVDRLAQCGIGSVVSHSSQYPGWRPGYVVVLSGPYATTLDSDSDLGTARGCGLAAYRRAN